MRHASLIVALLAIGCGAATATAPGDDLASLVAERHGLASWGTVESIHWVFNVDFPGVSAQRVWEWEPATGDVTLHEASAEDIETPLSFDQRAVGPDSPEDVRTAHEWFINDSYWLLFTFHLVWDTGTALTDDGSQPLPIGDGEARRLTITYGSEGGYTPGDTYHLYLGDDLSVLEWTYNRGGMAPPISFTWRDRATLGPLTVYLDHQRSGLLSARVWFSDVWAVVEGERVEPESND